MEKRSLFFSSSYRAIRLPISSHSRIRISIKAIAIYNKMLSDAVAGALVASISGLLGMCLAKTKCAYTNHRDGHCERRCAFMDSKLIDNNEIELEHINVGGVELLAVRKKDKPTTTPNGSPEETCVFPCG